MPSFRQKRARPEAVFIGIAEGPDDERLPLFNIDKPGHDRHGSTVTLRTLRRLKLRPPLDWAAA